MKTTLSPAGLWFLTLGLGWAALDARSQDIWFDVGPAFRGAMRAKLSGGSYAQSLGLHAAPLPLAEPAEVGKANEFADRLYQDGYVKLDAGTLNPASVGGPGNTWNWAYDNPAQHNATANTLTFHQQGQPGFTTLRNGPASGREDLLGEGIQANLGFVYGEWGKWTLEFVAGFQGIWGEGADIKAVPYAETISRLDVADQYDVSGALHPTLGFPPPRTAPGGYSGTYAGPFGGPSSWAGGYPVIPNLPASRTLTKQDLSLAQSAVRVHASMDFYELSLSPRLRYAATDALSLHLTPHLGVGYSDVSAERSEVFLLTASGGGTTTLASWTDRRHRDSFRFAAGLSAGADFELGRGFYAGVFGGYDWVINDVRFAIGPNTLSLDASGFVAGAAVGKRF